MWDISGESSYAAQAQSGVVVGQNQEPFLIILRIRTKLIQLENLQGKLLRVDSHALQNTLQGFRLFRRC